jgi:hypothetical protein
MAKRIIIATILGIICGFICFFFASSSGPMPLAIGISIILSRTLLGFGIGISCFKWSWWLHGIIMGIIFSLPMAFGALNGGNPNPEFNAQMIFWSSIVMGVIYGLVIELVTSVIFKAKAA